MSENSKGISVGSLEKRVYVRVVGRGTFQNSQPLRRFAQDMIGRGCADFFVDLADCQGMDSTFLGVLAGIGLRLQQDELHGKVHIVNPSPGSVDSLQTLGLDRLFTVQRGKEAQPESSPPADTAFHKLPDSDITEPARPRDKSETTELMLEAHDNLVRADERNAPKFRDVRKFLQEKLDRHRTPNKEQE